MLCFLKLCFFKDFFVVIFLFYFFIYILREKHQKSIINCILYLKFLLIYYYLLISNKYKNLIINFKQNTI